jgi:hypothetical protein
LLVDNIRGIEFIEECWREKWPAGKSISNGMARTSTEKSNLMLIGIMKIFLDFHA